MNKKESVAPRMNLSTAPSLDEGKYRKKKELLMAGVIFFRLSMYTIFFYSGFSYVTGAVLL